MKRLFTLAFVLCALLVPTQATEKNKGPFSNLVVFLSFADETDDLFERPLSFYERMFNDSTAGANSVYNYFKEASYNQLFWTSYFYPAADATGKIVSYKAQNTRGYYQKYSSINPDGYTDDAMGAEGLLREQKLIKELVDYLATIVPADAPIDGDGNGVVDNICIIVSGRSAIGSTHLLWPHRSVLYTEEGSIQGKKVNEYIMLFDDANGFGPGITPLTINTGVLCHELAHTLGTYDLYHGGERTDLNPIGVWDLTSDNLTMPQNMSAYTKYKYGNWLDEIPEISEPGTYTLNPINTPSRENIAYKIHPTGSDQYFVVEYRKKEGFDAGIPASGLLVYRVDPRYTGNNAYDGVSKFDELYLFRPGGTKSTDGDISKAAFSAESGRIAFGGEATEKPFYTNGETARFAIGNVSACGETISFDLLPVASRIYLPADTVTLSGNAGSSTAITVEADTSWQIASVPEWLTVTPTSGHTGKTSLSIIATTKNETSAPRYATIVLDAIDEAGVSGSLVVCQMSGEILAPTNVQATTTDNGVDLTWSAPVSGATVLSEDFESDVSVAQWTIRHDSENPKQWIHATADKYTETADGSKAMKLEADWESKHQDEWLISPAFAQGQTLSFHSKSIAPQKNNAHNFYFVLVSSDDGATWQELYDLKTQSTAVNKYETITLDLTPYMSDAMRIAFRGYDDNNEGLSYWWIVDGITVFPAVDASLITGYNIYRNGEKIATTAECRYTDATATGEASYQISAVTSYGETALSEAVTVGVSSLSHPVIATKAYYDRATEVLVAPHATQVTLFRIDGQSTVYAVDNGMVVLHSLPVGLYVARIVTNDGFYTVKFLK